MQRQRRLFAGPVHVVPHVAAGSLSNSDPGNRSQLLLQCTAIHRVPRTARRRDAHHVLWRLRQGGSHREHDLFSWTGGRSILPPNPPPNFARPYAGCTAREQPPKTLITRKADQRRIISPV